MKKTYEKPTFVNKGKLATITAFNGPVIVSGLGG